FNRSLSVNFACVSVSSRIIGNRVQGHIDFHFTISTTDFGKTWKQGNESFKIPRFKQDVDFTQSRIDDEINRGLATVLDAAQMPTTLFIRCSPALGFEDQRRTQHVRSSKDGRRTYR